MDSLFYFLDHDFWNNPGLIALFSGSIFLTLIMRYFTAAIGYRSLVRIVLRSAPKPSTKTQLRKEIIWSTISSLIFTALTLITYYLFQKGFTKIYTDITDRSAGYFVFSILLLLFLYETYYYWLHRWMHKPSVFKIVHKVHHQSVHPTVFTSFSFHPIEAILQFVFLPIALMVIPIHYYALGIVLLIMTVSAVMNHAGVEIFSRNFMKTFLGKWVIGSTHHDLHHKEFKSNYGLYLTFWDRWMKTENKNFETQFNLNKAKIIRSQSQHRPSVDDPHM